MGKIKPAGKIALLIVVVGAVYGGYRIWSGRAGASAGPSADATKWETPKVDGDLGLNRGLGRPLHVAVNQWPGWLGGIFANDGLKPNKACIYWQKYNLLVEFKVMDDPVAMVTEYQAGRVDLAWSTIDTAATQLGGLKKGGAPSKILFQVDYSQGGDAIVARAGINSIEDLKGKQVCYIPLSPSDTLFRYGVLNSSLNESAKKALINGRVEQSEPTPVVSTFKAGKVDAIVTWEPNITAAIKDVDGAHVIFSSESAATLIGDCFFAQDSFIDQHKDLIEAFIKGWFDGAAMASQSPGKAVKVMDESFPDFKAIGEKQTLDTFNKVKLCSLADNAKTFGLGGGSPQFDIIFSQANSFYVGAVQDQVTADDAKSPALVSFLKDYYRSSGVVATKQEEFNVTPKQREEARSATPIFTKPLTINFPTASSKLTADAKQVLNAKVVPLLRTASNAIFRIEGNTDSTGSASTNKALSELRARAVVSYLAAKGFNPDRLIPIGNGPDKPVADNSTDQGRRANRRTDIKVIAND